MAAPQHNVPVGTSWETALLDILGAPQTTANYKFINAWTQREHGTTATIYANNPFFTTAGGGGAASSKATGASFGVDTYPRIPGSAFHTGVNSAGVPSYPDINVGVTATEATLEQYPGIVAAIKSGNPEKYAGNAEFQRELTTWSGGGYSSLDIAHASGGPTGPGLVTPFESAKANDFWSGRGGAAVIGSGLGALAAGGASLVAGAGATEAGAAGAGAGAGGGSLLTKLLSGAAGKTGFAVFLAYMAEKYGKDWLIRGGTMLAGGLLIIVGIIMVGRGVSVTSAAGQVRGAATSKLSPIGR